MSILNWLLNPSGLTPHGFCLSWAPGLIATHVGADAVIGLAYFSIPLAIAAFVGQRRDLKYGWVAYLFVAFILACGTTHFMAIFTLWFPAYGIEGIIKLVTAILSIATALLLWPLIPKVLAVPSAAQMGQLNTQLARKIEEQERTAALLRESEARIRLSNVDLERRVAERTAELTATNARLTEALAQRDLLLREVYHRVKNNLQIVDSLLVLQERRIADPVARQALLALRGRIYALGLVHHQLMGSTNLKTFDIAPFLEELSSNILDAAADEDVSLSVNAIPLDVDLDFAIPLALLVTELVTNSLKHAFPTGKGNIDVSLRDDGDGAVVLVVADDGRGYESVESSSDGHKTTLGTRIIKGLVAQLGGTMVVHSQNGTRTEIRLAAPVLP